MISSDLKAALQTWLDDVQSSKPSKLCKRVGLCSYVAERGSLNLMKELLNLFISLGMNKYFPFNRIDGEDYYKAAGKNTQHLNPKRIAWVKAQLEQSNGAI